MAGSPIRTTITYGRPGGLRAPLATITPPKAVETTASRLMRHPMIKQVGNGKAEMFIAPNFLTSDGCQRLIALIDRDRRPSTVADPNGDTRFRTSETCDMKSDDPVVADISGSIFGLMGIDAAFAEPVQGQRYDIGGEFKLHCDTFRPGSDDYDRYCRVAGQRTWTAMVYLNVPAEGGHTLFPHLDVDMKPQLGTMLMWNNLAPDGSINPMTAHHATPVVRGRKDIITQWFRERHWG